ncbi:hypothetical protein BGX33_006846 [Mortierella sp. NVP41]|nr:hypothetical protein BGX33_006846 [Mortierella sp. NVP41]
MKANKKADNINHVENPETAAAAADFKAANHGHHHHHHRGHHGHHGHHHGHHGHHHHHHHHHKKLHHKKPHKPDPESCAQVDLICARIVIDSITCRPPKLTGVTDDTPVFEEVSSQCAKKDCKKVTSQRYVNMAQPCYSSPQEYAAVTGVPFSIPFLDILLPFPNIVAGAGTENNGDAGVVAEIDETDDDNDETDETGDDNLIEGAEDGAGDDVEDEDAEDDDSEILAEGEITITITVTTTTTTTTVGPTPTDEPHPDKCLCPASKTYCGGSLSTLPSCKDVDPDMVYDCTGGKDTKPVPTEKCPPTRSVSNVMTAQKSTNECKCTDAGTFCGTSLDPTAYEDLLTIGGTNAVYTCKEAGTVPELTEVCPAHQTCLSNGNATECGASTCDCTGTKKPCSSDFKETCGLKKNSVYRCSESGEPELVSTCEENEECVSTNEGAFCASKECKCPRAGVVCGANFPSSCNLTESALYNCEVDGEPEFKEDCKPGKCLSMIPEGNAGADADANSDADADEEAPLFIMKEGEVAEDYCVNPYTCTNTKDACGGSFNEDCKLDHHTLYTCTGAGSMPEEKEACESGSCVVHPGADECAAVDDPCNCPEKGTFCGSSFDASCEFDSDRLYVCTGDSGAPTALTNCTSGCESESPNAKCKAEGGTTGTTTVTATKTDTPTKTTEGPTPTNGVTTTTTSETEPTNGVTTTTTTGEPAITTTDGVITTTTTEGPVVTTTTDGGVTTTTTGEPATTTTTDGGVTTTTDGPTTTTIDGGVTTTTDGVPTTTDGVTTTTDAATTTTTDGVKTTTTTATVPVTTTTPPVTTTTTTTAAVTATTPTSNCDALVATFKGVINTAFDTVASFIPMIPEPIKTLIALIINNLEGYKQAINDALVDGSLGHSSTLSLVPGIDGLIDMALNVLSGVAKSAQDVATCLGAPKSCSGLLVIVGYLLKAALPLIKSQPVLTTLETTIDKMISGASDAASSLKGIIDTTNTFASFLPAPVMLPLEVLKAIVDTVDQCNKTP